MTTLNDYLEAEHDSSIGGVIMALAKAGQEIAYLVARDGINRDLGANIDGINSDGDEQKALDVLAEEIIVKALNTSDAVMVLSEEQSQPIKLQDKEDGVIVAMDPLDGSSNIAVNVTIGTIFSLLPASAGILQKGRQQLAAGFITYGAQTTMILAFANSDDVVSFVLDPDQNEFIQLRNGITIPQTTKEYAVNSAYAHHWFEAMKTWMEGTLAGRYRMRWVGSLVADAWRIFCRGGVFLYPADQRPGYENGRLRLVYEANPMAFLAEKAGGMATDGKSPILDIVPEDLHQRVPLFFGAKTEIERLQKKH